MPLRDYGLIEYELSAGGPYLPGFDKPLHCTVPLVSIKYAI
jgi:hypothetical protein